VSPPRLQAWLDARWYGGARPGLLLRALERLFAALARLRRSAYRRGWLRSTRLPLPLLVVGNIAVGGAGKTPMTIALVEALRVRGWRPGVISRGHGGSQASPARLPAQPDPTRFGDEPCLIAARTGAPVAVARQRAAAGRLLLASGEVDLLIADDGLQHYALARDVEIAMIDGRRRFGNGRLLPAGPLREPPARIAECAFRVVNGGPARPGEVAMALQLGQALPLCGGAGRPLPAFAGSPLQAVAGIAEPARFFAALREAGLELIPHAFADHHPFSPADFAFDDGQPLLMTEKDAVKCRGFARANWYAVPACAMLPDSFFDAVSAGLRPARQPA
jgi:tetraacyldisaccharide 4'-kinase